MFVVAGVAGVAIARGERLRVRTFVATGACKARMSARESEFRLAIVIKRPERPAVWCVATLTARTKCSRMRRIAMTGGAALRSRLVLAALVAAFAGHRRMKADEWKRDQIMVEA